mmetsp:Transcript_10409/g.37681  ORF Transcript_10409/g.37681 Transcript_10409/m.37681 type:complete len:212 (+) Transcript_10409:2001-2636(+)
MRLGDDRDVRDGDLQRADALLLRDEAGDAAVHLRGEEALGADAREAKHAIERGHRGRPGGERHGVVLERRALQVVRLLRHVSEHLLEVEVLRRRRPRRRGRVHELHAAAAVDAAEDAERAPLARADALDHRKRLGGDQHRGVFLILRAPNLEHAQRRVPELHRANVQRAALGVDELLAHVAIPARALVVDAQDRVVALELDARLDDTVELV